MKDKVFLFVFEYCRNWCRFGNFMNKARQPFSCFRESWEEPRKSVRFVFGIPACEDIYVMLFVYLCDDQMIVYIHRWIFVSLRSHLTGIMAACVIPTTPDTHFVSTNDRLLMFGFWSKKGIWQLAISSVLMVPVCSDDSISTILDPRQPWDNLQ